jgi:hypothetical protein
LSRLIVRIKSRVSADVRQYLPGPDRRKLVDVSHQQQRSAVRQGTQQSPHQRHIDHRGLIDNEQVAVKRRLLIAPESPGSRVGFEETMDGYGFQSGAF